MIKMKPLLFAVAASLAASSASAEMLKMFPYKDPNWAPEFSLAVTGGIFDPQVSGMESETSMGLQLSLNCPWFGPPVGSLRQNINYNVVSGDGYDINTFEINPRWYAVSGNLRYGAGPGFGYMWIKPDVGSDATTWTVQASAAVEYRINKIVLGVGTRYQHTFDQDIYNSGDGLNNLLTDVKIGFDF